jgi:hypothetical protein
MVKNLSELNTWPKALCLGIATILTTFYSTADPTSAEKNGSQEPTLNPTKIPSSASTGWMTDEGHFRGQMATNGFACTLWIHAYPFYVGQLPPTCAVTLFTGSTNIYRGWSVNPPTYCQIGLFDATGRPVERTEMGKEYERVMDQEQVRQRIKSHLEGFHSGRFRVSGFLPKSPKIYQPFMTFGIPNLFRVKEAGKYVLKVKMRLIQRKDSDSRYPDLEITPIPDVDANIEIREADIHK